MGFPLAFELSERMNKPENTHIYVFIYKWYVYSDRMQDVREALWNRINLIIVELAGSFNLCLLYRTAI